MKRYRYHVEKVRCQELPADLDAKLQELGEQGWQLCDAYAVRADTVAETIMTHVYIFSQEIVENAPAPAPAPTAPQGRRR